jgi:pentose-5-phosphate-3-epimerase
MTSHRPSVHEADNIDARAAATAIVIAPSVLSVDFTRLGDAVRAVDGAGSAIFGTPDYAAAITALRASATAAAGHRP